MSRIVAAAALVVVMTSAAPAMAALGCFYKRIDPTTLTKVDARNPAYVRVTLGGALGTVTPAARDDIARSESGDPDAQYGLARRFAAGDGVPQNYELALLLMRDSLLRISGDTRDEAECFAGGVEQFLAARARPAAPVPMAVGAPTPVSGRR